MARRPHTFHAITRAHDELSHVTVRTASVMRADTSTTGNSLAHPPPTTDVRAVDWMGEECLRRRRWRGLLGNGMENVANDTAYPCLLSHML